MKTIILFLLIGINILSHQVINEYKGICKKIVKGSYILKFEDGIKEQDILNGSFDEKFKEYKREYLCLDKKNYNQDEVYYIRILVKNNTKMDHLEIYSLLGPVTSSKASCVYNHNGKEEETSFTTKIYASSNKNALTYGYAAVKINPGEIKKIYIKLNKLPIPLRTDIYVTELDKIILSESNYSKITSFLVGLTSLVSFFSIIFYLRFGKKYFIYYSLICSTTYLKTKIFMDYLRSFELSYTYQIYLILSAINIIVLIGFIADILKLNLKKNSYISNLDSIKYINLIAILALFFDLIDIRTFVTVKLWSILALSIIAAYVSYIEYKKGNKAYLYSFLPHSIYCFICSLPSFNIFVSTYDARVLEQQELLVNIVLIGGILFYELKELIRGKSKLEESENIIATINESDNLMHAIQNVVNLYKDDIKYSKIMFFRRMDVLIGNKTSERLNYSFSLPAAMEKSKNILYLEDMLHRDKFKIHYICNDISNNELYDKLLPNYKSMMGLRLSALNQVDFGYILILNENETEYEYNDIIKDFRYKITLVTQHFVTKEDEERKYGTALAIKASSNLWVLSVQDGVENAKNAKEAIERVFKIMPRALSNDKQINKALEATIKEAETYVDNISKDLDFGANDKIYRTKTFFKFKWIKEVIRDIKELINRLPNCKLILNIDVKDKQEFYAQAKMLESVLEYSLTYLYKKVKATEEEVTITLTARIVESKLMISTLTEGLDLEEETIKKEYKDEVQVGLLDKLKCKKELSVTEGKVNITYYFNILKAEDKKEQHLNYSSINEEQDEIKDEDEDDEDNDDDIYEEEYEEEEQEEQEDNYDKIDPDSGIDTGLNETYKKLRDMPIDDYFKKYLFLFKCY